MEQISSTIKNSTPWETKDFNEDVDEKFNTSIQGILKHWEFDSSTFYSYLEDRLTETTPFFNSKILRTLYQASVNMVVTPKILLVESRTYETDKGVIITAIPVNSITEFWLAMVSTFEALY